MFLLDSECLHPMLPWLVSNSRGQVILSAQALKYLGPCVPSWRRRWRGRKTNNEVNIRSGQWKKLYGWRKRTRLTKQQEQNQGPAMWVILHLLATGGMRRSTYYSRFCGCFCFLWCMRLAHCWNMKSGGLVVMDPNRVAESKDSLWCWWCVRPECKTWYILVMATWELGDKMTHNRTVK